MKPSCLTPSGKSIPAVVGGLTTYMRSAGATRPPVVLYQARLFHANCLSMATKKPLTMRLARVPSASCERSSSLTWIDLPFSSAAATRASPSPRARAPASRSKSPMDSALATASPLSPLSVLWRRARDRPLVVGLVVLLLLAVGLALRLLGGVEVGLVLEHLLAGGDGSVEGRAVRAVVRVLVGEHVLEVGRGDAEADLRALDVERGVAGAHVAAVDQVVPALRALAALVLDDARARRGPCRRGGCSRAPSWRTPAWGR